MNEETQQLAQKVIELENKLNRFLDAYYLYNFPSEQLINKNLTIRNGKLNFEMEVPASGSNYAVISSKNQGLKICEASTDKIGLYGATPVVRASAITAPSGGLTIDAEARTAIGSIITAIKNIGVTL